MTVRKILDKFVGEFHVKLEMIESEPGVHDYGIPHTAWIRGVRFMDHFGAERALELIDQRAERAADRRDYDSDRRWRDLIVAIHAMQEEEHLPGDKTH
jgi:hypothetical protein